MIQQQGSVTFTRPPEAPVYYPTEEEFSSPLQYIQSIKAEAERFGICKIVPPKSFKPTFAVNKDTFKFKARYQRLSDLDGFSRSRHSFACMLRRFWTDQGWPADLPVPMVGEKYIDWYDLYIGVHRAGGYKAVTSSGDGWNAVARQLGIASTYHAAGRELKAIYDKNLLPYDEFRASVEIYLGKDRDNTKSAPVNKSAGCRRMKKETPSPTAASDEKDCDGDTGILQETDSPNKEGKPAEKKEDTRKMRSRRSQLNVCYSEVVCEVCKETDEFDNLKFCEKCETTYHLRCIPASIRKDKAKLWLCPKCMKETYDGLRACHTFGFEHTAKLYTLDEFQKNANDFKRKYFGASNVGLHVVEAEFWRLLADSNDETVVEYGADLHRGEQGSSGFPTESDRQFLRESERDYIDHPWNLNKLPDNELSILKHITVQISGMKVPWMYVGMVFSAFCWHTEDHWSASINFVHLGEPKTWYGVPGTSADAFETAFKELVPILTESNPDLLHQLVTHMNPTVLQQAGIPIYRVDQRAGEFVVTFPRAYHAGFNQGFNFAEAVNFCLADWIPHGRLSVGHYSNCKRDLVFSHDELICCMADQASQLHHSIAKSCHLDFMHMVEEESANRQKLIDLGIVLEDEPTLFEFMDDHERACSACHTTLFLSAVRCSVCGGDDRLACARHASQLCSCEIPNKLLLYRYSIDDLSHLLGRLLKRTEVTAEELKSVAAAGTAQQKRATHAQDAKFSAAKRQKLFQAADSGPMDFFSDNPDGSCNNELKAVMKMASEVVSPQTITRNREASDAPSVLKRWKASDVESLVTSLMAFPGTGKEVSHVREYLRKYYSLQGDIRAIFQTSPEEQDAHTVRRVYDQARSTSIETEDLSELQSIVQQTEFRERIIAALNDQRTTIQTLAEVLQTVDEIFIRSDYMNNMVALLTSLIDEGRNLEIDAENIASHGQVVTLADAKRLLDRADAYPIDLNHVDDIRDGVETIEKLIVLLEGCKKSGQRLHYQAVQAVLEGEDLSLYHSHGATEILKVSARAAEFLAKLRRLFFGCAEFGPAASKNPRLLDVLCPRRRVKPTETVAAPFDRRKKKNVDASQASANDAAAEPVKSSSNGTSGKEVIHGKIHPFDLDLDSHYDSADLRTLFERACWDEQTHFERIRETNCLKSAIDSDLRDGSAALRRDLRWCVCGGHQLGTMIQCDSCFDWFHVACTRMAEFIHVEDIAEFGLIRQLVESIQFMCDFCQRGVRPPLDLLTQLLKDYQDVDAFFCVPEMDLTKLVIARAEKWRRAATNIVLELPGMVHAMNNKCATVNRDLTEQIRLRLRDTLLAVLLEGNLLEVKVPEWMFLYDFVHENFRKDRSDEASTRHHHLRPMVLPVRSGRLPLAVDMISPLFRKVSKNFARPLLPQPIFLEEESPVDASHVIEPAVVRRRGRQKWDPTGGGGVRVEAKPPAPRSPLLTPSAMEEPSSDEKEPASSTSSYSPTGKRTRRRVVAPPAPTADPPVATRSRSSRSSAANQNLDRPTVTLSDPSWMNNDLSNGSTEACFSCHTSSASESHLSVLENGQLVPMCTGCAATRNSRLRRQRSTSSITASETANQRKLIPSAAAAASAGPRRRVRPI